jgi:hypothetical protein
MCNQIVRYWVPRVLGYCEVETMCGYTMHDGSRAICAPCGNDPRAMAAIERAESSIEADNAWAASAGWGEY